MVFKKSLRNFLFGSYLGASCLKSSSFSYLDRTSAGDIVNSLPSEAGELFEWNQVKRL